MLSNCLLFHEFLLAWCLAIASSPVLTRISNSCNFPAIYNFGDSNSDTGGISAAFKPVTPPYGNTFFHRPAGRSCDGRLIVDFIAERLQLPYLSAYLNSLGTSYRHGANFATGGSTIRRQNETIYQNGISPFSLDTQIVQFDQFKARCHELYTQAKNSSDVERLPLPHEFSKALYTFDIGQNDLSVGFRTKKPEELRAEIPDIITQLASAIKHLYVQGGRAFWVHNTAPIGCMPVNLFYIRNPIPGFLDKSGCVKSRNEMAIGFNIELKDMVTRLRKELPEARVTHVDVYSVKYELIQHAKALGFGDPLKPCCGYHKNFDHIWCGDKGVINGTEIHVGSCRDPSHSISWDGVHYTEAANKWVADRILNGHFVDPPIPISRACHAK